MSIDSEVTKNLMEILADGREGFAKAADKLDESDRADLAGSLRRLGEQRDSFYDELQAMAATYGDTLDESPSIVSAIHRGWMSVKDAISGSSPEGVLDAAEQGEDHAVSAYDDALQKELSGPLRLVVERQRAAVKSAHDVVRDLRDTIATAAK